MTIEPRTFIKLRVTSSNMSRIEAKLAVSQNTYVHSELSPDYIRLIRLKPGKSHEPIKIGLVEAAVDTVEDLRYIALSYVWGKSQDSRPVFCNGESIFVTPNLYDALLELRECRSLPLLWIDQITINQRDLAEKTEQVRRMGKIYAKAEKVWIWLSKAIWRDSSYVHHLNTFYQWTQMASFARFGLMTGNDSFLLEQVAAMERQANEKFPTRETWETMLAIFSCGYFRRVWMVQEITLAVKPMILMSGCEAPWSSVVQSGSFMQFGIRTLPNNEVVNWLMDLPGHYRKHTRGLNTMTVVQQRLRMAGLETQQEWSLLDLVRKTALLDCTDPRDRVYAVLGLLGWNKKETIGTSIVPDYTAEVDADSLMRKVFIEGLTSGALMTLLHCSPDTMATTPSWMGAIDVNFGVDLPLIGDSSSYNAGGPHTSAHVNVVHDKSTLLQFDITPIGRIVAVCDPFPGAVKSLRSTEDRDFFFRDAAGAPVEMGVCHEYFGFCEACLSAQLGRPLTPQMTRLMSRAFTCDHALGGQRIAKSESFGKSTDPALSEEVVAGRVDEITKLFVTSENSQEYWRENYGQAQTLLQKVRNLRFACVKIDGTVFDSEKSHESGATTPDPSATYAPCWLPYNSQVGDLICAVHGLSVPMLVRPHQEHPGQFRFWSPCFVQGYMDGEALESPELHAQKVLFA